MSYRHPVKVITALIPARNRRRDRRAGYCPCMASAKRCISAEADPIGAGTRRRRPARHRHHRRRILRHLPRHPAAAPRIAGGTRLLIFEPRTELGAGAGLRHARLSVSTQRGRGRRCRSMPRSRTTSSTSRASRASTPPPATIYRARCMANTCARGLQRDLHGHGAPHASTATPACCRRGAAPTAAGNCGSTTAAPRPPTTWCWRSAIRRRRRSAEFAPIAASGASSTIPGPSATVAHENIEQRPAAGQRAHDDRRGAASGGHPPRVRHIHVLSRHGFLPQSQATASAHRAGPLFEFHRAASVRRLTRALRTLAGESPPPVATGARLLRRSPAAASPLA